MSFFVQKVNTYAAKNRAWKKVTDFVSKFEYTLIRDECSRDSLSEVIMTRINEINSEHPKLKPIRFSCGNLGGGIFRIDASVDKLGCPDMIFIMDMVQVRSVYEFSEVVKGVIE